MFLKNHAKSKVFQNNWRQQAFFVKIWCQVEELGDDSLKRPQAFFVQIRCQVGKLGYNLHKRTQSFRNFDQALTSPTGVQRRIYTPSLSLHFEKKNRETFCIAHSLHYHSLCSLLSGEGRRRYVHTVFGVSTPFCGFCRVTLASLTCLRVVYVLRFAARRGTSPCSWFQKKCLLPYEILKKKSKLFKLNRNFVQLKKIQS